MHNLKTHLTAKALLEIKASEMSQLLQQKAEEFQNQSQKLHAELQEKEGEIIKRRRNEAAARIRIVLHGKLLAICEKMKTHCLITKSQDILYVSDEIKIGTFKYEEVVDFGTIARNQQQEIDVCSISEDEEEVKGEIKFLQGKMSLLQMPKRESINELPTEEVKLSLNKKQHQKIKGHSYDLPMQIQTVKKEEAKKVASNNVSDNITIISKDCKRKSVSSKVLLKKGVSTISKDSKTPKNVCGQATNQDLAQSHNLSKEELKISVIACGTSPIKGKIFYLLY